MKEIPATSADDKSGPAPLRSPLQRTIQDTLARLSWLVTPEPVPSPSQRPRRSRAPEPPPRFLSRVQATAIPGDRRGADSAGHDQFTRGQLLHQERVSQPRADYQSYLSKRHRARPGRARRQTVAGLKTEHVKAIIRALAATPGAANKMLRTIKMLMRHAIAEGWRTDDPTFTVKKVRMPSADGFHSWTEAEVAAYEARHPVGTKARLALDLLVYTAQRRADVVRMGPQHIDGGMVRVKQQKTGTELQIPILPPLAASLAATPTGHLCFPTTAAGKPLTAAGFGN